VTLPPYTRNMTQAATYWPPGSPDGFGGVGYGAAVAIRCRWQDKAELFRGADGQELTSSAVIYPDRPLARKGKIALGTVAGAPSAGAREIRQISDSPDLRGTKTLHKVWL